MAKLHCRMTGLTRGKQVERSSRLAEDQVTLEASTEGHGTTVEVKLFADGSGILTIKRAEGTEKIVLAPEPEPLRVALDYRTWEGRLTG